MSAHIHAATAALKAASEHLRAEINTLRPAGLFPDERAALRADQAFLGALITLLERRMGQEEGDS